MNPKKATHLCKSIAEESDIDQNLLEDLIEFTFKTLRKKLSNLEHPRINLDGLGQFVAKPFAVKKAIETTETKLVTHDTSTFGAYHHKKMLETKLQALKDLHVLIVSEEEKKANFKKAKYESKA